MGTLHLLLLGSAGEFNDRTGWIDVSVGRLDSPSTIGQAGFPFHNTAGWSISTALNCYYLILFVFTEYTW